MKKTKCDGEFPCKRCKDDGLVCTAGTRKKTEYKQIPRGYAEVLENTQHALIATVHKLYSMVRTGQSWDLGEPELNERGQPVIHNIATKLGCIRPNAEIDLPPHSVFPEDEAGLARLAAELDAQQQQQQHQELDIHVVDHKSETESTSQHTDRATPDLDHSDFEQDYRKAFLGNQTVQNMSPQSFASYNDFEVSPIQEIDAAPSMFPMQPSAQPSPYPPWQDMNRTTISMESTPQFMQSVDVDLAEMMLSQGLVESEFGTINPHILSCPNPEVMLGMGDPMMYSGYNGMDPLRS